MWRIYLEIFCLELMQIYMETKLKVNGNIAFQEEGHKYFLNGQQ